MKATQPISALPAVFAAALLLLPACSRKDDAPTPPPPPVNDLVLPNLSGEFPSAIRTAVHKDSVQLLLFLRTDDAPCRATVPEWNALLRDFSPRGFVLLGLVSDPRPDDLLAPEISSLGADFPVGRADDLVVAAFGGPPAIHAVPTAFLLGRDGKIARSYPGFVPFASIRKDLDLALDGLPLPRKMPAGDSP